jgi:hypothetical protein
LNPDKTGRDVGYAVPPGCVNIYLDVLKLNIIMKSLLWMFLVVCLTFSFLGCATATPANDDFYDVYDSEFYYPYSDWGLTESPG